MIASIGNANGAEDIKSSRQLADFGPLIEIEITQDLPGLLSNACATKVQALIDTGADGCCIDEQLALELGLLSGKQYLMIGANGEFTTTEYLARIFIPALNIEIEDYFAGIKISDDISGYRFIIGRDFLKNGMLIYRGLHGQADLII